MVSQPPLRKPSPGSAQGSGLSIYKAASLKCLGSPPVTEVSSPDDLSQLQDWLFKNHKLLRTK